MPGLTEMGREQFVLAGVARYTAQFTRMSIEDSFAEVKRVIDNALVNIVKSELDVQNYLKDKYSLPSDLVVYMQEREAHGKRIEVLADKITTLTTFFVRAEKDGERFRHDEFLWLRMAGLAGYIEAEFDAMKKHLF